MVKHIHWLLDIEDGSYEAVTKSTMASQRLRAGCMMQQADAHKTTVTAGNTIPPSADHLIVGKIGAAYIEVEADRWIRSIQTFSSSNRPITLDFTDNHLDSKTEMTSFYSRVIKLVDSVVCSSELLASATRKHFNGAIYTIPDPIEIEPIPPKSTTFWPRTILWFGHSSNLSYLVDFLPFLQAQVPVRIIILSDIEGLKALEDAKVQKPDNLLVELRAWSNESLIRAAAESDCCIIPSDPNDPRKAGVSSNRLLTALALGLPTIASELASYLPFIEYFNPITSNESINVMIDPCAYAQPVLRAHEIIIPKHSMQAIGNTWFNLLSNNQSI